MGEKLPSQTHDSSSLFRAKRPSPYSPVCPWLSSRLPSKRPSVTSKYHWIGSPPLAGVRLKLIWFRVVSVTVPLTLTLVPVVGMAVRGLSNTTPGNLFGIVSVGVKSPDRGRTMAPTWPAASVSISIVAIPSPRTSTKFTPRGRRVPEMGPLAGLNRIVVG